MSTSSQWHPWPISAGSWLHLREAFKPLRGYSLYRGTTDEGGHYVAVEHRRAGGCAALLAKERSGWRLTTIVRDDGNIDEVGWKAATATELADAFRMALRNRRARPMQPEPAPRTAPQVPVVDDWTALQAAFEALPSLSLRQDKAADGYEAITVTQHGDEPVAKLVRTAMGWRVQALFRGGVELKDSGGQSFSTAVQVASAFRLVEKRLVGDQERIRQGYLKAPRRPILLRETPRSR